MNLKPLPALDSQASTRDPEETATAETREADSARLTTPGPATANVEPSPSERLFEAYRLWAFTGR